MTDTRFSDGRRRTLRWGILIIVAGAGACLAWAISQTFWSQRTAPAVPHVCESCRHEWRQPLEACPVCPKCGAAAVLATSFRCPKCMHVWEGLHRRKLGPGRFQYKLPHTEVWLAAAPEQLTCPNCSYTSGETFRHALPGGGTPPATAPARKDYE